MALWPFNIIEMHCASWLFCRCGPSVEVSRTRWVGPLGCRRCAAERSIGPAITFSPCSRVEQSRARCSWTGEADLLTNRSPASAPCFTVELLLRHRAAPTTLHCAVKRWSVTRSEGVTAWQSEPDCATVSDCEVGVAAVMVIVAVVCQRRRSADSACSRTS